MVISASLTNARVVKLNKTANIIPARDPRPILPDIDYTPIPDLNIYNSNSFYPACPLSIQYGHSGNQTTCRVYLTPAIYNPQNGELYLVIEGEVEVSKALTMKFGEDDFRETEKVLTRCRPEDQVVFGEMAMIAPDTRSATLIHDV